MPRAWVELATRLFVEGTTQLLVGTRALLGEGWNCPPLNVLIDMTIATTGVSVQQMRGRSLRLDRNDPLKVASNWDIVCVAPDLVRGNADYERFVRKHLNLFAPAEDGQVEAGPSHVHPELGPFGPPPVERFRDLNRELLARAADRDGARELWQIGTPYRGVELPTLLVRSRSPAATAPPRATKAGRTLHLSQRVPIGTGLGGGAAFGVLGVAASAPPLLAGLALVPAGLAWAAVRLAAAKQRLPLVLPLDASARAVIEAYRELDELSPEAASSLTIEPRSSGYLRCELTQGHRGGGEAVRDRPGRAGQHLRQPALPRLASARRPAPRRARAARARAHAPSAVRRAIASRARRSRPQQGTRRGVRPCVPAIHGPGNGSCSRSAARKATRPVRRRPQPTAATRRCVRDVWV